MGKKGNGIHWQTILIQEGVFFFSVTTNRLSCYTAILPWRVCFAQTAYQHPCLDRIQIQTAFHLLEYLYQVLQSLATGLLTEQCVEGQKRIA